MSNNPAYDPTDPRYYDAKDLRSEAERIFSLCADCRLCVRYCGSFPKLFDAVDDYCTGEKYSEVDTKKLKTEDINEIVDLCFQCKLCYIKCPYTPGNRLSQVDGAGKGQAGKGQGRTVGGQGAGSSRRRRKVGYGDVAACQLPTKVAYIDNSCRACSALTKTRSYRPLRRRLLLRSLPPIGKLLKANPLRKSLSSPPATLTSRT